MIAKLVRHLIRSAELRSAARRYARELGPRLRHDYGAGQFFSAAQIRVAAEKCRLPLDNIAIGLAAFMAESAFAEVANIKDYQSLRELFARHSRRSPHGSFATAEANSYAFGADPSAYTVHHSSDIGHSG